MAQKLRESPLILEIWIFQNLESLVGVGVGVGVIDN